MVLLTTLTRHRRGRWLFKLSSHWWRKAGFNYAPKFIVHSSPSHQLIENEYERSNDDDKGWRKEIIKDIKPNLSIFNKERGKKWIDPYHKISKSFNENGVR